MGREAILSDCSQHLRESAYEYEQLLGSSMDAVWQAISSHVERQLTSKKGVNIAVFGKFTFLRDLQPVTPVFILADRFVSLYGVAWKRPPPALLAPTVDVSMSMIGGEVGIPKEQTLRTLEALVAFLGSKLQKGSASGRLRLGNVGFVCFEDKALSFAFNPGFTKSIVSQSSSSSSDGKKSLTFGIREPQASKSMQRSISLETVIPIMSLKSPNKRITNLDLNTGGAVAVAGVSSAPNKVHDRDNEHSGKERKHKEKREHKRHLHTRPSSQLDSNPHTLERSSSAQEGINTNGSDRQLLPRFLIASKRVPDGAKVCRQIPGSQYALAMQSAFDRELELRNHKAQAVSKEDDAIATRHHATQLRKLQESSEQAINRRDLNAFLNGQIEEKQSKQRKDRLQAARATDYETVKILPHDSLVTEATKRDTKHYLCKRLEEQVAAKDALKKDERVLEQAESAYFISKLKAQTEAERRELLELKRIEKEALLDGWRQQQALQNPLASSSLSASSLKRIR